jgi:hypothetical protein
MTSDRKCSVALGIGVMIICAVLCALLALGIPRLSRRRS